MAFLIDKSLLIFDGSYNKNYVGITPELLFPQKGEETQQDGCKTINIKDKKIDRWRFTIIVIQNNLSYTIVIA